MARELTGTTEVVVLCWNAPTSFDRNAFKIAAFLGAEVKFVSLTHADGNSIEKLVPRCTCVIAQADTLAKVADVTQTGVRALSSIFHVAEHGFIYGIQPTERHTAIVTALSSGWLVGVEPFCDTDSKFHVAVDHRESCGQFSGLSLGAVNASRERVFVEGPALDRGDVMIRAGAKPFFARINKGGCRISLLACDEVADLDEPAGRSSYSLSWFSRLVPLMMFLRGTLGDRVWHNDHPRACFFIDDPLLKNPYGFLDFRRLLESIRQKRFSACIAFIPWNYRRSSKTVAELISSNYGPLFLCVHGCDHTKAEFEATDATSLVGKAQLALARMRTHQQLSGVPFDDVMVFPQGRFSAEAVGALKIAGYLAAVNGSACPSTVTDAMTLRDSLEVAVTRFSDFPVFSRRYPRDLAEFALDLFVGKPALAVEHHGYFRNGYEPIETFIERLNSLDQRLEWVNPEAICSHACLTRTDANGEVQVRFYTNQFRLKNDGAKKKEYLLLRRQRLEEKVRVTINGHEWNSYREDNDVKIRLSLDAGQSAELRVTSETSPSSSIPWKATDTHRARVWVRRFLCEIRDNHVDTTPVLNQLVSTARNVSGRKGLTA